MSDEERNGKRQSWALASANVRMRSRDYLEDEPRSVRRRTEDGSREGIGARRDSHRVESDFDHSSLPRGWKSAVSSQQARGRTYYFKVDRLGQPIRGSETWERPKA